MAVNNNAAAVMLVLAALAEGREVPISRGELIEIGDGFRIPDVLAQSGARLVEVGSTNRTRIGDYARVLGPETGAILRVHQSNFRMVGFTDAPSLGELARPGGRARRPGDRRPRLGPADRPARPGRRADRAVERRGRRDRRLLLGRQAPGRPAGRRHRRNRRRRRADPAPSARARRPDRQAVAGRARGDARALSRPGPRSARGARCCARWPSLRARCTRGRRRWPSGSAAPSCPRGPGSAAARCRCSSSRASPARSTAATGWRRRSAAGEPPVVARVQEGRVLLDCRTLTDDECLRITL